MNSDEVAGYPEFLRELGLGEASVDLFDVVYDDPLQAFDQVEQFLRSYPEWVRAGFHQRGDRLGYGLFVWGDTIWAELVEVRVSIERKLALIETMKIPFVEGLPIHPEQHLPEWLFHWWDNLCEWFAFLTLKSMGLDMDREPGASRKPMKPNGELGQLHDALFAAMVELLEHPDENVQTCAIHGLNHSYHVEARPRLQRYLDEQCSEEDDLEWIELCRDGKAN